MILEPYYARNAPQDEIAQVVQRAEAFFLSSCALIPWSLAIRALF